MSAATARVVLSSIDYSWFDELEHVTIYVPLTSVGGGLQSEIEDESLRCSCECGSLTFEIQRKATLFALHIPRTTGPVNSTKPEKFVLRLKKATPNCGRSCTRTMAVDPWRAARTVGAKSCAAAFARVQYVRHASACCFYAACRLRA